LLKTAISQFDSRSGDATTTDWNREIGFGYFLLNCNIDALISQGIKGNIKVSETDNYKNLNNNLVQISILLNELAEVLEERSKLDRFYHSKYKDYISLFKLDGLFK